MESTGRKIYRVRLEDAERERMIAKGCAVGRSHSLIYEWTCDGKAEAFVFLKAGSRKRIGRVDAKVCYPLTKTALTAALQVPFSRAVSTTGNSRKLCRLRKDAWRRRRMFFAAAGSIQVGMPVMRDKDESRAVLDGTSSIPITDGESQEIGFTALTKEAQPVARRRIGGLSFLRSATARSMRRMQQITARADDMIINRGANVEPTQFEVQIFAKPEMALHFHLEAFCSGLAGSMAMAVEANPSSRDAETAVS